MTLTAIGRPPADMPRKTWPIPPLPSCPSSRYGPISRGSSGCSPAYPTIHPEGRPKLPFMVYPDDAVVSSPVYTRVRAVRFSLRLRGRPDRHGAASGRESDVLRADELVQRLQGVLTAEPAALDAAAPAPVPAPSPPPPRGDDSSWPRRPGLRRPSRRTG